jgi:DNA end-binding protein Ku
MAPRANWKGYLKLSLVSCAVQLFPAASTRERVSFHLLNRETGHRLRRQLIDESTGEVVESEDQVRGYEIAKREYVTLEDDEIESVAIESTHTIDIESFVPRAEIDEVYLDAPYYLTPDGKVAEEAFSVIREAMQAKKVVGLGRVVLSRRERIVMLEPRGKGIAARTLRYAYEVRDDADYFEDIDDVKVSGEMLELAEHIIDKKLTTFDPSGFEDRYQTALVELIKAKTGHRPAPKLEAPRPTNVINLMDALRRSIAAEKGETAEPKAAPARAAAKRAATSSTKSEREASRSRTPAKSSAKGGKSAKGAKAPARRLRKAG